ncbi:MAG: DUF370 domain-containing protein [Acidaminococcaceae bacterium]|nr:DUF370 domain-containing protein [Acidaminococcaceae bacterium]HBX74535.1 DUF370 domain-containing protein [Acidaminococcaceae bacterium]
MFVHLGGGCLIEAAKIIGIFSVKENKDFYISLKNKNGESYNIENVSEKADTDSVVLTENGIYLSPISASTLQKRINQNLIYNNGGNNG